MFQSLRYQNPKPERSTNGLQDPSNDPSLPLSERSQSPFSPTLGVTADQYAGGNSFYQTMNETLRPSSPDMFNFNIDDYMNFDQEPSSPAVKEESGPSRSPTRSDSSSVSSKRQKSNDGSARSSFSEKIDDTAAISNHGLPDNFSDGTSTVVPNAQPNGYLPHLWGMETMNQMTYDLAVNSAESSPTDSLGSKSASSDRIGGMAMPYEPSPNLSIDPTITNEIYHETLTDSSSSSPIAMNLAQPAHAHPVTHGAPQNIPINAPHTYNIFQPAPQHFHPGQWHNQSQCPANPQQPQQPQKPQKCLKLMYLSQDPDPYRSPGRYFDLLTNRLSTRVETALDIRLVFTEPPAGISKLRMHVDHLTKIKQLKDAYTPLTPDTLELHVTAFLHTAMKTANNRQMAMNKALTRESSRTSAETNDYKPMEGSPMKICDGCVARERKRLCRSKRKPDETDEWLFKASHCLLGFNSPTVVDWKSPSSKNTAEQLLRQRSSTETVDGGKKKKSEKKLPMPSIQAGTVGADVQMRICCYCRHQHEVTGFEVVFTLTDHLGKVFGQQMSKPIMITDDHKDKERKDSAPPTPPDPVASTQAPGQFMFSSVPTASQYPAGPQQSYSTPNLMAMANGYGFITPQNYAAPQQCPVTHVPHHNMASASNVALGILTPQNRSRQASPTRLPEPQQKKRKASVSGRMFEQLRMTPMQSPQAQNGQSTAYNFSNAANINALNGNALNGNAPNGNVLNGNALNNNVPNRHINGKAPNRAAVAARRPAQNQFICTHRFANSNHAVGFRTNPPSPLNGGFGALTEANRSQSMGDFSTAIFSAPNSSYQSRSHSPNADAFSSYQPELAQALEQGLRNAEATNGYTHSRPTSQSGPGPQPNTQAHRSSPPQSQPQPPMAQTALQPPVIENIAPGKGSIVGGDLCIFIGRGFRSDLQVLFGDHRATEVRSLAGGETLSCRVPRGDRAGPVKISFVYPNPQRLPSPSIATNHLYTYVDEDSDMSAPQALSYPIQGQSAENPFDCGQASQQYPVGNMLSQWAQGPNMHQQSGMPQHTRTHSSGQGFTETPPSYHDVLAEDDQRISDLKTRSTLRAVGDALMDRKATELFELPIAEAESSKVMQRVTIGGKGLSREQTEKLRAERNQKVKGLRNDRKLWTVWIPLLILVIIAMFWNRFPQIWHIASMAFAWLWDALSQVFSPGTSSCRMPPGTQHEVPRIIEIG